MVAAAAASSTKEHKDFIFIYLFIWEIFHLVRAACNAKAGGIASLIIARIHHQRDGVDLCQQ